MLHDEQRLLDYLAARAEIDRSRVGATGMCMGFTRARGGLRRSRIAWFKKALPEQ